MTASSGTCNEEARTHGQAGTIDAEMDLGREATSRTAEIPGRRPRFEDVLTAAIARSDARAKAAPVRKTLPEGAKDGSINLYGVRLGKAGS